MLRRLLTAICLAGTAPLSAAQAAIDTDPARRESEVLDAVDRTQDPPAPSGAQAQEQASGGALHHRFRLQQGLRFNQGRALEARINETALQADVDRTFGAGRVVFSNTSVSRHGALESMTRELYTDWNATDDLRLSLGKKIVKLGVAHVYSPTNFLVNQENQFMDASYLLDSQDHVRGTDLLEIEQTLGDWTATVSHQQSNPGYSSAVPSSRHLWRKGRAHTLVLRHAGWLNLRPTLIMHDSESRGRQYGLNVTVAIRDTVHPYLEYARAPDIGYFDALLGQTRLTNMDKASAGFTARLSDDLTLVAEYSYNQAGFDATQWQAIAPFVAMVPVDKVTLFSIYNPTARQTVSYGLQSRNLFKTGISISLLHSQERTTLSRSYLLAASYEFKDLDVSFRAMENCGPPTSVLGSFPVRRQGFLSIRYHF